MAEIEPEQSGEGPSWFMRWFNSALQCRIKLKILDSSPSSAFSPATLAVVLCI